MRIGILTHFKGFDPGYALHVGWLERARLLEYHRQNFHVLVDEGCPTDIYPAALDNLPAISSSRPFEERVKFFEDVYRAVLEPYDVVLTADIMYQRKGNHLARNQAIRNVASHLKAQWFHWIHSSWVNRPENIDYPETLRFMEPPGTLVYLNSAELAGLARMYQTSMDRVACVYNPKDVRSFLDFHDLSWSISRNMELWDKDVIQVFPHCSTRMEAKGIDDLIKSFAGLKRAGKRVALILANGNARKVLDQIEGKKRMAKNLGLVDREDYVFTHEIACNMSPLPRKSIADLFKLANLFIFPTWRETTGNAFQEALISDNLLVLNRRVPCLLEMGQGRTIYVDFTSKTPGVMDHDSGDMRTVTWDDETRFFDVLAEAVLSVLPDRSHLWRFSYDWIWENQFEPLLYGNDREYQRPDGGITRTWTN